jgi:hypothetical protein
MTLADLGCAPRHSAMLVFATVIQSIFNLKRQSNLIRLHYGRLGAYWVIYYFRL